MNYRGLALFGGAATIGLLLYQQHKINRMSERINLGFGMISEYIESELQAVVDEEFNEIVENYDD